MPVDTRTTRRGHGERFPPEDGVGRRAGGPRWRRRRAGSVPGCVAASGEAGTRMRSTVLEPSADAGRSRDCVRGPHGASSPAWSTPLRRAANAMGRAACAGRERSSRHPAGTASAPCVPGPLPRRPRQSKAKRSPGATHHIDSGPPSWPSSPPRSSSRGCSRGWMRTPGPGNRRRARHRSARPRNRTRRLASGRRKPRQVANPVKAWRRSWAGYAEAATAAWEHLGADTADIPAESWEEAERLGVGLPGANTPAPAPGTCRDLGARAQDARANRTQPHRAQPRRPNPLGTANPESTVAGNWRSGTLPGRPRHRPRTGLVARRDRTAGGRSAEHHRAVARRRRRGDAHHIPLPQWQPATRPLDLHLANPPRRNTDATRDRGVEMPGAHRTTRQPRDSRRYRKAHGHADRSGWGGVGRVIRALRHLRLQHPGNERIAQALGYFSNNQHRMGYADANDNNLPIGSGVVEATCKTLVTERLKRSGMRWSMHDGEAILTLRAWLQSHRFDSGWAVLSDTYRSEVAAPKNVVPLRRHIRILKKRSVSRAHPRSSHRGPHRRATAYKVTVLSTTYLGRHLSDLALDHTVRRGTLVTVRWEWAGCFHCIPPFHRERTIRFTLHGSKTQRNTI